MTQFDPAIGSPSRPPVSLLSTAASMRLLIIEDDREAADYLVKAFREVGHVADRAIDGEEGLALALDGQYDVMIIDRMLPKMRRAIGHRRLAQQGGGDARADPFSARPGR